MKIIQHLEKRTNSIGNDETLLMVKLSNKYHNYVILYSFAFGVAILSFLVFIVHIGDFFSSVEGILAIIAILIVSALFFILMFLEINIKMKKVALRITRAGIWFPPGVGGWSGTFLRWDEIRSWYIRKKILDEYPTAIIVESSSRKRYFITEFQYDWPKDSPTSLLQAIQSIMEDKVSHIQIEGGKR